MFFSILIQIKLSNNTNASSVTATGNSYTELSWSDYDKPYLNRPLYTVFFHDWKLNMIITKISPLLFKPLNQIKYSLILNLEFIP